MLSKTSILLSFDELEWKVIENALLIYSIEKYQQFIDTKDNNSLRFAQHASRIADEIKAGVHNTLDNPWEME